MRSFHPNPFFIRAIREIRGFSVADALPITKKPRISRITRMGTGFDGKGLRHGRKALLPPQYLLYPRNLSELEQEATWVRSAKSQPPNSSR